MQGIMLKPEMRQAIVDLREIQTRRLDGLEKINKEPDAWRIYQSADGKYWIAHRDSDSHQEYIKPRYQVGDIVYIKEAWWQDSEGDIYYKTDWIDRNGIAAEPRNGRWRSPLFMPAGAARYFIKITGVRYERLQSITLEACIAEGIHAYTFAKGVLSENPPDPRWAYQERWDEIYPDYPWASNPWDVAYSFSNYEPCGKCAGSVPELEVEE